MEIILRLDKRHRFDSAFLTNYSVEKVNFNIENFRTLQDYFPWISLIFLTFSVVGFIGNLLVCMAIRLDIKLQNATNFYLFSLALVDLCISVFLIPISILKNFNGS